MEMNLAWDRDTVRNLKKNHLIGLYLRSLAAILFGFFAVVLLNLFTPLDLFDVPKAFLFAEGRWLIVFLFYPLIISVAVYLQYLIQKPISETIKKLAAGEKIREGLKEMAQRRLLNLPFLLSLSTLVMWIILPSGFAIFFRFLRGVSTKITLFFLFRAIMIGMVASALSFFMLEGFSRKRLIPLLFPKGRLNVTRTVKIPIIRRIRVLYMAGTSVPMIILVGTLIFTLWEIERISISAADFGREFLIFTVILCMLFIAISLRLNFLVGKSIVNPLREMLRVVEKVRDGDFSAKIRVLSNDEVGVLGDAGNLMIAGLKDREKIRDTFGKYVNPEIRDQILAGRIPLNGQRTEATLLFSDLRDFTPYVERNDPEEVIRSMREYFTAMERAIRKHRGLVLQYVGDEIEAVFGVPLAYAGHADKALLAALEMRKCLEALNEDRTRTAKLPFRHGIGIHTGSVLVGNTGSEDRLSYALVGNTVNVASRIQELTREFNCDILINEETVLRLENPSSLEKKPSRTIKGYSKPVTVFRVL